MAKSLSKIWLRGLKRLLAIQTEHAHKTTKRIATRPARPATSKPSAKVRPIKPTEALRAPAKREAPRTARESRVRPRASAWASGSWTRSFHSAPAAPGRLVNHLQYGLYIPSGHALEAMPLVVMLHGCTQSIDEFAAGTRMNVLADRFGFAVVYPEQSKHAHSHRCWHWYDSSDSAGGAETRAVVSLVDALVAEHGFDSERVYVAGISAGAGLTALLAINYPERFAAVALHSGPAFGEAHSGITAMDVMRRGARGEPAELVDEIADVKQYPGMPALIIHGDADHVVAPVNAEQLAVQFLRLNRIVDESGARKSGDIREERKGGMVMRDYVRGGRRVVRLCRVQGLAHAWSGGDDALPFHSAKGPDASALVWEFFRHQRRTGAGRAAESTATAASADAR
ncbi:extracellular catalytic domain type 1 short-chain-length polyhydroxyalkanoate depolymerase [Paraburkholderia sp. 22099]|jgi:poly(hydroxyalkanoate) depolymerase family esterase|uniref:extracellular catalytic domain type 1 short-chain-length polyhydroxyalkanoate depolymerase n=1 Tax=Paraburkholderia TaxID=1822464 RepID=UPI0009F3618D|nr:PHB depolymerase family esterase [Paraburkholderia terricola]MDR6446877.1 poly(hydroxyalkanoate) depolymerase family esterase [Paraburkholderia terricola]MDR6492721.1 poly(hydroxyalkanoate) depolymerase family esterase [Paraburkholderia terricola]ORC52009.1 esterase [Burkholderia sp. A27]